MRHSTITLVSSLALMSACVAGSQSRLDAVNSEVLGNIAEFREAATIPDVVEVDISSGLLGALPGAVLLNSGYRAAVSRENAALQDIGVARSAGGLQASTTARAGGLRETGSNGRSIDGGYGNIRISQLLTDGGATAAAIDAATARALIARAERVSTENAIAQSAAQAWIDTWKAQQRLVLLRERSQSLSTLVDQIDRMSANGMVDISTLDSARRQLVEVNLQTATLEQALRTSASQFERYFKSAPPADLTLPEAVSRAEALSAADQWSSNPAIQIASAQLVAAEADLKQSQAAFQPRASAQAGADSPIDSNDPTDLTFGLAIEYQIASGGQRRAALAAAEERSAAAAEALTETMAQEETDFMSWRSQLVFAAEAESLAREQRDLRVAEADTARSQIVTGQSSLRQLIDAEVASYQASDAMISARADRISLQLAIAARAGVLSLKLDLSGTVD